MPENNEYNKKKDFLIKALYFAVCLAIYYVIFRYVIYIAWPFAIALLLALISRKPTLFISKKLHIPEKGAAAIITLLLYLLIAGVGTLVVVQAIWAIINWSTGLPALYNNRVVPALEETFEWMRSWTDNNPEIASYLTQLGDTIIDKLSSLIGWISSKAVSFATGFAVGVPKAIIGTIFMVISSFFISMDYDRISKFFMAQFTPNQQQIIVSSKEYLGTSIFKLLWSYFLIMTITFIELNIGLRILHIPSPTIVALVIAIFDILPALGTGGIVIPWFVIEFILGNTKLGIGLAIMYIVITVVRNVIEPKIVGENIGIHPVLMLMSIYLGAVVLGPLGIIIVPFTLVVVRKLNDAGLVNFFKTGKEE